MTKTRTPGITILADGRRFIGNRYLGVRIGLRVRAVTKEQAEERLRTELARVQNDGARKADARPTFTEIAGLRASAIRGAVFYPPVGFCARALASVDLRLGRLTTFGAAFIALAATKLPDAAEREP